MRNGYSIKWERSVKVRGHEVCPNTFHISEIKQFWHCTTRGSIALCDGVNGKRGIWGGWKLLKIDFFFFCPCLRLWGVGLEHGSPATVFWWPAVILKAAYIFYVAPNATVLRVTWLDTALSALIMSLWLKEGGGESWCWPQGGLALPGLCPLSFPSCFANTTWASSDTPIDPHLPSALEQRETVEL